MYTAYAKHGVVSTDTDGGSYEWYMYSCTRYVLNLVSAMSHELFVHFSTCICVCTHTCTHIHLEVLIFLVHVQYLHAA